MLIVRRLRGILSTALMWALPWAVVGGGAVVALDRLWRAPGFHALIGVEYAWGLFLDGARFFALVGALAGALFAGVVALAERRRTFATLHTGRMLAWGAIGGAALPLLVGIGAVLTGAPSMLRDLVFAGIGASLGAGSAWTMLVIARRAPDAQLIAGGVGLAAAPPQPSIDAVAAEANAGVTKLDSGTMNAILCIAALLTIATSPLAAQEITVRRADGSERRLSATELATLPRNDFEAADHGVPTRFAGVELRALLQLAAAGPTDSLRGPMLRRVIVLIGADGYAATIALADLDPALGARRVYVVDHANGVPLAASQGPWRAIVVGDGRAARWVRQLQRVELVDVR